MNMLCLLLIPLRMSSWFHQGWNVSFQPLVKNIGLKPTFQNDGFLSHLYVSVQGIGLNRKDLNLYQCYGINNNARNRKMEGQCLPNCMFLMLLMYSINFLMRTTSTMFLLRLKYWPRIRGALSLAMADKQNQRCSISVNISYKMVFFH